MKHFLWAAIASIGLTACGGGNDQDTDASNTQSTETGLPAARVGQVEDRFALMALACVHKEYPNKISHVLAADDDVRPPRELTPAFYGCFDWHSAVHGHWLLTRILKTDPQSPMAATIREALAQNLTEENIAAEVAYFTTPGRGSFERPYGIAWLLQLVAELEESDDAQMKEWRSTLAPLEAAIVEKTMGWLPNLSYPIRLGTHNQTAFAFGLMLDYARTVGDETLESALYDKVRGFHMGDANCPIAYEPSGEDFLSPCLMEADLMRRILTTSEFAAWLGSFMPGIPMDGNAGWLEPGVVLDATDGKLVHLDGVNLSRAWALEGIAAALPADDPRRDALLGSAALHKETGIAAVSDEHYAGSHWLASFATYLTTQRGITGAGAP